MTWIGLDVDGTSANSIDPQLALIEKRQGIRVTKGQINRIAPEESDALRSLITKDQMTEIYQTVWKNYKSIKLEDPRIPAMVRELKRKFDIHIVTASTAELDDIRKWLRLNDIEFHKFTQAPNSKAKADVNVEIYIDDHSKVAEACSERGKTVILLRQPWNIEFMDANGHNPRIRNANDWSGVEAHLAGEHRAILDRVMHFQRRPLMPTKRSRSRH